MRLAPPGPAAAAIAFLQIPSRYNGARREWEEKVWEWGTERNGRKGKDVKGCVERGRKGYEGEGRVPGKEGAAGRKMLGKWEGRLNWDICPWPESF